MRSLAIFAALALAACQPKVITRDVAVPVKVPVAQPCASDNRPSRPATFESKTAAWENMDPRQRVAAISAWALTWVDYAEDLEIELAGCPRGSAPAKADIAPVVTASSSR